MHTPIVSLYGHRKNRGLIRFRLFIDGISKVAYTDNAEYYNT